MRVLLSLLAVSAALSAAPQVQNQPVGPNDTKARVVQKQGKTVVVQKGQVLGEPNGKLDVQRNPPPLNTLIYPQEIESENKFKPLTDAARELAELSRQVSDEIARGGSKVTSVKTREDLDRMEKLIKIMREKVK